MFSPHVFEVEPYVAYVNVYVFSPSTDFDIHSRFLFWAVRMEILS